MQSTSSPSSLRPKEEEAYVKSLLEMSRSRRRKKKEELKELQNSLFHFNDDGNNQEYEEINPARSSSSSRSRSTSPSFRGNNSSGNWTGTNNIHSSSPEQQQHYTTPTICSEVRRVATNYAHEQHKQLSDDIRASYLLKRMEELKRMNIKAMIDHSFNSSSCVTKDQSQRVYLSNITSPTSPTKSFPTNVNTPLSPHSKQYELERRKRVEARQEKLKNSPNTLEENYLAVSQQSPPQKLKRPSSARPTTQSQPQFQPNPNLIRSPEKFQTSQNSILNNSSRKHSQHAPDLSKTPDKLISPTKVQRPSSAPKSRVVQSVETPKKTVPYNQRRVVKPPLDPFEKEEKIILDQIQDLDDQLQKSVVFRSVVSSISDLPQKTVKPKETDLNNSIVSNRVSRPTTPSSSRKSNTRSPSSYSRCSNRPQSFETPKENSLEEIAKKNRERYGHIKPKVVSRRAEYSGSEQMATPSQNRNQRPSSALSGRVSNSGLGIKQFDDVSFSSTPKRPSSLPRKNRNENTRDLNDVRSVNISLKNILLEQEEYKRVWGEIEEEELRILKFTPKASQNSKSEKPEKDTNISDANEKYNSFTKLDFDDNSESNFKSVMRKRIEEIEMGLKKIASLDPNETRDGDIVKHEESFDNNQTQDMESHYRILFDSKDNHQSSYPSESSQLIEIDLEQSKISSCGEEDTTTIIEERVSNNIDAFLSHGESDNRESPKVNESMLSSSFIGDTSQIPSNPEFRKFINDKLDMLEKELGPNGRGKSNVGLDIKLLRVSKLEDLITTRGNEKEAYACVQLLFSRDDENSKQDEGLPMKHELSVTLFKEKGIRKYKLDGKHVTIRAVQNFLFQHGLRHSSNFVIFQNHVVSLMFKNPKEIAEMITDGSGGLSFEQQAEKTLSELEGWKQTEEHLNEQIDKLEKLIEEDKEKLAFVSERKKCEHEIAEVKLALSLRRRVELEDCLAKEVNQLEELTCKKTDYEKRKQQVENEIASLDLENLKSEMKSIKTMEIIPMQKQISEITENLEFINEEVDQLNNNYQSLLIEKSKVEEMEKHRDLENENLREELRVINSKTSTISEMLTKEKLHVTNQVKDVNEVEKQIDIESHSLTNLKERMVVMKSNIQNLKENIKKNEFTIKQKSDNLSRNSTVVEYEDISSLKHECLLLTNQYNKMKEEIERDERYLNSLEISKDSKSVLVNMISLDMNSSSHCLLALSVIMGKNFSTHIVETTSQSERILQIMSQKKKSVVVWPLDRLDSSQQHKRIAYQRQIRDKKGLKFIIPKDILKYEQKIESAIDRCFGDFVISPSEEISKQLIDLGISSVTLNGVKHLPGKLIGGDVANIYQNSALKKRAIIDHNLTNIKELEASIRSKQSLFQEMENDFNNGQYEQDVILNLKLNNQNMSEELNDLKTNYELLLKRMEESESKLLLLNQTILSCKNTLEKQEYYDKLRFELRELEVKRSSIELMLSNNVDNPFPEELLGQTNEKIISKECVKKSMIKQLNDLEIEMKRKKEIYSILKKKKLEQENKNKILLDSLSSVVNSIKDTNGLILNLDKSIKKRQKVVNQMGESDLMIDESGTTNFKDKSVEDLEVIVESLEKKSKVLAKKSKSIMVDVIDLEKKQTILESSKSRLTWISKSCQVLMDGIACGQKVVEKYNEVAFEKVQLLFQKFTDLMLPNKIASLKKVGEKVADGIEIVVKSKNSQKEGDASQLSLISGGEKTMVSLAFLFSIATFKKSMFYILDECDANLDEEKQKLVSRILSRMFKNQQVILISHNSAVQNEADCIIHV